LKLKDGNVQTLVSLGLMLVPLARERRTLVAFEVSDASVSSQAVPSDLIFLAVVSPEWKIHPV
jgi:hypothetical protein